MAMKTYEEIEAEQIAKYEKRNGSNPSNDFSPDEEYMDDGAETEDQTDASAEGEESKDSKSEKIDEVERLRQDLAKRENEYKALYNRLAPTQRELEETRRQKKEMEEKQAEYQQKLDELQNQIQEQKLSDPSEFLTEDERYLFDDEQLQVIDKLVRERQKMQMNSNQPKFDPRAETEKVLREREQQELESYREQRLRDPSSELSSLSTLIDDPDFIQWTKKRENIAFEPIMSSLLNADNKQDIDSYAETANEYIKRFKGKEDESPSRQQTPTDTKKSLESHMERRPKRRTGQDVDAMLAEVRRLSKSSNKADRDKAAELIANMK